MAALLENYEDRHKYVVNEAKQHFKDITAAGSASKMSMDRDGAYSTVPTSFLQRRGSLNSMKDSPDRSRMGEPHEFCDVHGQADKDRPGMFTI